MDFSADVHMHVHMCRQVSSASCIDVCVFPPACVYAAHTTDIPAGIHMHVHLFSISTLVDVVRIPPSLFGTTLKKAAINILKEKYESMINAELGYIIMILDAKVDEMGKMIAGDGGTFHKVQFEALTFYPKLQEIVQGEIVDITDFGAFVRIGPTDALLHLSQVMDDYLKSDVKMVLVLANHC